MDLDFDEMLLLLRTASEQSARGLLAELECEARAKLAEHSAVSSSWFDHRVHPLLALNLGVSLGQQAEVLLLFAQWYTKEGDWPACLAVETKAVDLAREAHHLSLLRRALTTLGAGLSKTRQLERATLCFAEALQIADELGDRMGKCATLANLAECRFNAGLLDESIRLNEHVIELIEGDAHFDAIAGVAHHNTALAALTLSDVPTALSHIERAAALCREPKSAFATYQRIVLEVTYTKILIAHDRFEQARERAEIAKALAQKIGGRMGSNQARLAEALCDMVTAQPDAALWTIERLKEEVHHDEPILRDVIEAEILGYRQTGRQDDARRCQQRYLFHLSEWQRKHALKEIADVQRSIHDPHDLASEAMPDTQEIRRPTSTRERRDQYLERLTSLAMTAEVREDPSGDHAIRVGRLTYMLALRIGKDLGQASILERAARLHDLGKLAVPDAIIFKRGKLSRLERDILRRHTFEGCQMITDVLASLDRI